MLLRFDYESAWLQARKADITSTDVASLFGLNPFKSRLRLYHEKAGNIEPDFSENNFTKWGRRLQIPVGMGICEDAGWTGYDLTGYYARDPARRLASSFDMKIKDGRRVGLLEIKIAENFSEESGWFQDRSPLQYEFQLQTQLHVLRIDEPKISWGVIGTLGRRQVTRLYEREYDPKVGALIDEEVEKFWASIVAGIEPKPDYAVDGPLIERLRKPLRAGDLINLTGNNRAHDLIESYAQKKDERKTILDSAVAIESDMQEIKAELWSIIGRNEKAIIGPWQVSARVQHNEEKFVNASSFRRFDISKRKA